MRTRREFCVSELQEELRDLGGPQTWLGLIHDVSSHIARSTLKTSTQNRNSCFAGEKNGIYAVWAIRTWKSMNQKSLNPNDGDLLQAPLQVSLTPVFHFLKEVPD